MHASDPILLPSSLIEASDALPIVRLPHPRTRLPALFVIRPGQGIWEIQSVVTPPTETRTWFFQPPDQDQPDQVLSRYGGRLLFVTAFDPFFLLLGLFFGANLDESNPFQSEGQPKSHQARFEEADALLERFQERWVFADGSGSPSAADVEIFAAEALRPDTLCRVCADLQQDPETRLWRIEPDRVTKEVERKVDQLAKAGAAAGRESHTVWSRLANKEGLSAVNDEPSLLEEIYRKVGFQIIQAYLAPPIHAYLSSTTFRFSLLDTLHQRQVPVISPLKIGRKTEPEGSKSSRPAPKRPKKEPPPVARGTRTLGDMWASSSSSRAKASHGSASH